MDPLEPSNVIAQLSSLVNVSSPIAALAAIVHGIAQAVDFQLKSNLPSFSEGQTDYAFRYSHNQSSMTFEMKVGKLGNRGVVNGIAVEDDKTRTLDIALNDYFSASAFSQPVSPADLASTFNSPARLKDLINSYKRTILQPLIPGLQKEGYLEETAADARNVSQQRPPQRGGFYPDAGGPLPYGEGPRPNPPVSPLRAGPRPDIGRSDLEPLGGLGGTTGPRVPIGGFEGDGMIVGPNHPLFRDRFSDDPNNPLWMPGRGGQPQGPWGGDGFLPPMGAPPGARFDPVGPFTGGPRPGAGGFGNLGPRRGGSSGGFGEPDFDEAPPPGNSDYDAMFS